MQEWIDRLVKDRYKTVRALAQAIGMTDSGFGRAVQAGTFEVENCLRLAHETKEPASNVFAMAGKTDVDELIRQLYGPPPPSTLSKGALGLARSYDEIKDKGLQDALKLLTEKYRELEGAPSGRNGKRPKPPGRKRE